MIQIHLGGWHQGDITTLATWTTTRDLATGWLAIGHVWLLSYEWAPPLITWGLIPKPCTWWWADDTSYTKFSRGPWLPWLVVSASWDQQDGVSQPHAGTAASGCGNCAICSWQPVGCAEVHGFLAEKHGESAGFSSPFPGEKKQKKPNMVTGWCRQL